MRAGEYDWEIVEPLREGHTYDVGGEFTDVERKPAAGAACSTR